MSVEKRLRRLRNWESSESRSFLRMKLRPVCMKGLLMSTTISRLAVTVRGATAISASCTQQQQQHTHTQVLLACRSECVETWREHRCVTPTPRMTSPIIPLQCPLSSSAPYRPSFTSWMLYLKSSFFERAESRSIQKPSSSEPLDMAYGSSWTDSWEKHHYNQCHKCWEMSCPCVTRFTHLDCCHPQCFRSWQQNTVRFSFFSESCTTTIIYLRNSLSPGFALISVLRFIGLYCDTYG